MITWWSRAAISSFTFAILIIMCSWKLVKMTIPNLVFRVCGSASRTPLGIIVKFCLNMSGIYEQNRTNKPYTAVRSNLSSSNSSWCRYCHLHQLPTAQHTNYRHNHYQYRECEWADCCPAPSGDHCAFQISNLVFAEGNLLNGRFCLKFYIFFTDSTK